MTLMDNLSKLTHLCYDAQGNAVAVKDALGNETDRTYTIANLLLQTAPSATGQTSGDGTMKFRQHFFPEAWNG